MTKTKKILLTIAVVLLSLLLIATLVIGIVNLTRNSSEPAAISTDANGTNHGNDTNTEQNGENNNGENGNVNEPEEEDVVFVLYNYKMIVIGDKHGNFSKPAERESFDSNLLVFNNPDTVNNLVDEKYLLRCYDCSENKIVDIEIDPEDYFMDTEAGLTAVDLTTNISGTKTIDGVSYAFIENFKVDYVVYNETKSEIEFHVSFDYKEYSNESSSYELKNITDKVLNSLDF